MTNNRNSKITIPSYRGKKGNPVIWGKSFFPELSKLEGDIGGRALFDQHPAAINLMTPNDPSVITDIDSPQDFDNWVNSRVS